MTQALKTKARTLTYALRHKPSEFGLNMQTGGWVPVEQVLNSLDLKYGELELIILTDNKGRFSLSPDKTLVRANQGHSINIDLQLDEVEPPEILYHGTVEKYMKWILADGLRKMSRHHVHLSGDIETAEQVASRRKTDNVILKVKAHDMWEQGHKFYLSDNGVWLTDHVPPEFLS